MNKVILKGNLTRDPELVDVGQTKRCVITVATNNSYTDKTTGQKVDDSDFHEVVYWGKQAETVAGFFTKGQQILVEGKGKSHKWPDPDKPGKFRYKYNIQGLTFEFCGKKGETGGAGGGFYGQPPTNPFEAGNQGFGGDTQQNGYRSQQTTAPKDEYDLGDLGPPLDADDIDIGGPF